MTGLYVDREQTRAKHFILEHYLQALAFKVLQGGLSELAYIDGFSGPWKSRAADHSDTSFMIAIRVLKDVQKRIMELSGQRKVIRCFFVEEAAATYAMLAETVAPHHDPDGGFFIETRQGRFQDFIPHTLQFIGRAFPLIFIDPTGWTGYPFDVIRPLLKRRPSEVLINFMFDHINRFAASDDPATVASLGEILGGSSWRENLDPNLPRGIAVEQLFRDMLRREGSYDAVLSTCIDKSLDDRPHFFIVYGTRHAEGVRTFRNVEYKALSEHEKLRQDAKNRKQTERRGMADMFGGPSVPKEKSLDTIIADQRVFAAEWVAELLREGASYKFDALALEVMQKFMLRETDVKDICVQLARRGLITDTWKHDQKRKPHGHHLIALTARQR